MSGNAAEFECRLLREKAKLCCAEVGQLKGAIHEETSAKKKQLSRAAFCPPWQRRLF
jgi:hypothetical protein